MWSDQVPGQLWCIIVHHHESYCVICVYFNIQRTEQNGPHFADDILNKFINAFSFIITIVPKAQFNNQILDQVPYGNTSN